MINEFGRNIEKTVIKPGLCIGCGICTAVCPSSCITMKWVPRCTFEPEINHDKCIKCGACVKVCPNSPEKISEYTERAAVTGERFGLQDDAACYISFDLQTKNRLSSASGGGITAILSYLLEEERVEGVIVAVSSSASIGSSHAEMKIIRSSEELERSRSTQYQPLSYDNVLRELKQVKGKYAIVGVPCVIRGIKSSIEEVADKIEFTFSLACSHNVTGRFLDCLAAEQGIPDRQDYSADLRDKDGITPDANNFNNYFKTGLNEIRKNRFKTSFTRMWRDYFFAQEGCLYCPDFYGADADISVKDAWGRLSSDPLGKSLFVVRNSEMKNILIEMKEKKKIRLIPCSKEEVFSSQIETPKFKHLDIIDRIKWKRIFAGSFPPQFFKERNVLKSSSRLYFKYRVLIELSNTLYGTFGARAVICLSKSIDLCRSARSGLLKQLSRLRGIVKGIVSPFMYSVTGLIKYPVTHVSAIKKEDNIRVLISGGYGYRNVGDEAQLASVISNWKQFYPGVDITVLTPDEKYTGNVHNVKTSMAPRVILFEASSNNNYMKSNLWFRLRFRLMKRRMLAFAECYRKSRTLFGIYPAELELLKTIASCDVLHLSGGGYLTGTTLSRLWDNMLLMGMADIFEKPVILTGQTIGIIADRYSKGLTRWGLSKAKLIYLRDPVGSEEDVNALGIKGDNVVSGFDDALFCDTADEQDVEFCLQDNGIDLNREFIAINVHYFGQEKKQSRDMIKRLAETCDHAAEKYDSQTVFIAMHPTDVPALEEVSRNMKNRSCIVEHGYDFKMVKGIIGKSKMLITMKHHGIIFAMAMAVPSVAIALDDYYVRKNRGALEMFGQGGWVVGSDDIFSAGYLEKKIDKCMDSIQDNRVVIMSHIEKMKPRNGEAIERFLSDIQVTNNK